MGTGAGTPVHNHTVWGLVGMLRGEERCEEYPVPGASGNALRAPAPIVTRRRGRVSPTIGDWHAVSNALADAPSISIHVYGRHRARHAQRVGHGDTAGETFRVGYSTKPLDRRAMSTIEEGVLHLPQRSHTHLTLNRPDKANSLAAPLVVALQAAIDTAKTGRHDRAHAAW